MAYPQVNRHTQGRRTPTRRQPVYFGGEYEPVYNSLGELSGLRKKLKKIFKAPAAIVQKVTRKGPLKTVKKILRKQAAISVGIATAGLVKPKFVGIKQKGSKKLFRYGGIVGKAVIAVVAAPIVAPYLASAGSAVLGGLKFVGGKLMAAPKAVMSLFASKGIDPKTATPEQAVQAGIETGSITPGMIEQLAGAIPAVGQAFQSYQDSQKSGVEYPGGTIYPSSPEGQGVGGGIMETMKPYLPWVIGGVLVAVIVPPLLTSRKGK